MKDYLFKSYLFPFRFLLPILILFFCQNFIVLAQNKGFKTKTKTRSKVVAKTVEPCKISIEQAPEIRGFKLGMTLNNVLIKYPQMQEDVDRLANSEIDIGNAQDGLIRIEHNVRDSVQLEDAAIYDSDIAFDGVANVFLFFIDKKLFEVILQYSEYEPKSIKDFQLQTAETLNLPIVGWKFSKAEKSGDIQYGPDAELNCVGFTVNISPAPKRGGFDNFASLTLSNPEGQNALDDRRKKKKLLEKEIEKRKKSNFKP